MPRNRGQSWPTFIRNHLHQTWACDFLTIVTLRFQILYCFVIVDLAPREIVHIGGVTSFPSARYAGPCFVEAVADRGNQNPRFMIRDRDSIYGKEFRRWVKSCRTHCLITPPRSPQANAICARLNGTLRRDVSTTSSSSTMSSCAKNVSTKIEGNPADLRRCREACGAEGWGG